MRFVNVCLLMLALVGVVAAEAAGADLLVKVNRASHEAASGVAVTIRRTGTSFEQIVTTNELGAAFFGAVVPGNYWISGCGDVENLAVRNGNLNQAWLTCQKDYGDLDPNDPGVPNP